MVSVSRMRAIALSLPEAEEKAHMGHPDFRVRNKIFATLWPSDKRAVIKLDHDTHAAVLAADPEAFSAPGGWGGRGWLSIDLTRVDAGQLRDLVTQSWRLTAPKTLVKALDGEAAPAPKRAKKSRHVAAVASRAGRKRIR